MQGFLNKIAIVCINREVELGGNHRFLENGDSRHQLAGTTQVSLLYPKAYFCSKSYVSSFMWLMLFSPMYCNMQFYNMIPLIRHKMET